MGLGDEQVLNEIVIFGGGRLLATAAALLRAIIGDGLVLDVTGMRHRHHNIFIDDQVLDRHFLPVRDNFRTTLVAKLRLDLFQFGDDDGGNATRLRENVEQIGNLVHHLFVFRDNLVLFKTGQALQLHFENALRLRLGQTVAAGAQSKLLGQPFRPERF